MTQIFSYGEYILWNNEAIAIENHSLFWKSWVERGIYFIQDILNSDGNLLTLDEFQTKFHVKTDFLQYFQLIAAIPSDLKKKPRLMQLLLVIYWRQPRYLLFQEKTNLI